LTGEAVDGGRWLREQHDFFSLPLLARPNSIIPIGANDHIPDYDFADGVTLHVFELEEGAAITGRVPTQDGSTALEVSVSRERQQVSMSVTGASKPWRVLLRSIYPVTVLEGGTASPDPLGSLITPHAGSNRLLIDCGD
jgi:alpha-D-xyloside xylohydrolase